MPPTKVRSGRSRALILAASACVDREEASVSSSRGPPAGWIRRTASPQPTQPQPPPGSPGSRHLDRRDPCRCEAKSRTRRSSHQIRSAAAGSYPHDACGQGPPQSEPSSSSRTPGKNRDSSARPSPCTTLQCLRRRCCRNFSNIRVCVDLTTSLPSHHVGLILFCL